MHFRIEAKLFLSLLLLPFLFASCDRFEEHECQCFTRDENGQVVTSRTVSGEFESKNEARSWCDENEEMDSTASRKFTQDCGLTQ